MITIPIIFAVNQRHERKWWLNLFGDLMMSRTGYLYD